MVVNEIIFESGGFLIQDGGIIYASCLFIILKVDFYPDGTEQVFLIAYYFGSSTTENRRKKIEMLSRLCDEHNCQWVICDKDVKNPTKSELNKMTKNVYVILLSCCQHDIVNVFFHSLNNEMKFFNIESLKSAFSPASFNNCCPLRESFFKKLWTITNSSRSQELKFESLSKIFATTNFEDIQSLCTDRELWNMQQKERLQELHNLLDFFLLLKNVFQLLDSPINHENLAAIEANLITLSTNAEKKIPAILSLASNLKYYAEIASHLNRDSITSFKLSISWAYKLLGSMRNTSNGHNSITVRKKVHRKCGN